VRPTAAFYSSQLGEFLLNYEDVRQSVSPSATILEFMESVYAAASVNWDNAELERSGAFPE
jgi:hypothetical protein